MYLWVICILLSDPVILPRDKLFCIISDTQLKSNVGRSNFTDIYIHTHTHTHTHNYNYIICDMTKK